MTRPTKLTPETQQEIATAIEIGCTYKDAACYAGVSYQSFRSWLRMGKDIAQKLITGELVEEALATKEREYLEFYEAIEQAEADCAVTMQSIIYNAAQSEPRWAVWWLERRRAEDYGATQKLDLQSDGQPIHISKIEVVVPQHDPHGTS